MAALECLSWCDYSLGIKAGVHFTLCGGTICKLGTRKHHDALLPRLDTLDLTGSFSMTEVSSLVPFCGRQQPGERARPLERARAVPNGAAAPHVPPWCARSWAMAAT